MNATIDTGKKRWNVSSKLLVGAFTLAFALVPSWAMAYDQVTTGRVFLIEYSPTDGFAFQLEGYTSLCTTGSPFSIWANIKPSLGHSPDMMKAMLSAVTAAKLTGGNIKIYADNLPDGSCKATAIDFMP